MDDIAHREFADKLAKAKKEHVRVLINSITTMEDWLIDIPEGLEDLRDKQIVELGEALAKDYIVNELGFDWFYPAEEPTDG